MYNVNNYVSYHLAINLNGSKKKYIYIFYDTLITCWNAEYITWKYNLCEYKRFP